MSGLLAFWLRRQRCYSQRRRHEDCAATTQRDLLLPLRSCRQVGAHPLGALRQLAQVYIQRVRYRSHRPLRPGFGYIYDISLQAADREN